MESGRILLVDDDPDILRIIKDNLELDNFRVITAKTGKEALHCFDRYSIALIVLDLSLPDIDGIQVCRFIREKSSVPIIMLTARDRVPDKVLGLESGADDYLAKPFDYLELVARIRACLRRRSGPQSLPQVLRIGDLEIDAAKNSVAIRGARVNLTQREFNLLLLLARNSDRVMDRNTIRRTLWPDGDLYKDSRAIDVHIQHLRSKLEQDSASPRYITTVPGVGYMLAAPEK
jgi:DNA-binding response OmpR family regulator